jgi:2-oxoglutarate ferredoxin oxidoreductase subunit delta
MEAKRGVVIEIVEEWCRRCGICLYVCPRNVFSPEADGLPSPVNLDACTRCDLCELACPEFALRVRENSQISEQDVIEPSLCT